MSAEERLAYTKVVGKYVRDELVAIVDQDTSDIAWNAGYEAGAEHAIESFILRGARVPMTGTK